MRPGRSGTPWPSELVAERPRASAPKPCCPRRTSVLHPPFSRSPARALAKGMLGREDPSRGLEAAGSAEALTTRRDAAEDDQPTGTLGPNARKRRGPSPALRSARAHAALPVLQPDRRADVVDPVSSRAWYAVEVRRDAWSPWSIRRPGRRLRGERYAEHQLRLKDTTALQARRPTPPEHRRGREVSMISESSPQRRH